MFPFSLYVHKHPSVVAMRLGIARHELELSAVSDVVGVGMDTPTTRRAAMAECLCFVNTLFIQLITTENVVSSSSTKRFCVHRVPSVRVILLHFVFLRCVKGPTMARGG
jgi:hypothetical protein